MPATALDRYAALAWASALGGGLRGGLRWASEHTGLPVVVVAGVAIVLGWRVFKRSVRLAVEVAVAVALLLAATRCGWITW